MLDETDVQKYMAALSHSWETYIDLVHDIPVPKYTLHKVFHTSQTRWHLSKSPCPNAMSKSPNATLICIRIDKIYEMAHTLRHSSEKPLRSLEHLGLFLKVEGVNWKKEHLWSLPMAYSIQRYVIFMSVKLLLREKLSRYEITRGHGQLRLSRYM